VARVDGGLAFTKFIQRRYACADQEEQERLEAEARKKEEEEEYNNWSVRPQSCGVVSFEPRVASRHCGAVFAVQAGFVVEAAGEADSQEERARKTAEFVAFIKVRCEQNLYQGSLRDVRIVASARKLWC